MPEAMMRPNPRHFLLTAKNDNVMREGMTFNLSIGFDGRPPPPPPPPRGG
jgi:nucleosome binding factor SPN SPT16 subunit